MASGNTEAAALEAEEAKVRIYAAREGKAPLTTNGKPTNIEASSSSAEGDLTGDSEDGADELLHTDTPVSDGGAGLKQTYANHIAQRGYHGESPDPLPDHAYTLKGQIEHADDLRQVERLRAAGGGHAVAVAGGLDAHMGAD